jgi:hypothetical protein
MKTIHIDSFVSNNLFDCAAKQLERNEIYSRMAEFLAKGGTIKNACNSTTANLFYWNENKDILGDKAQRVLDAITAGRSRVIPIAQAVSIPVDDIGGIINFLISKNLIEKVGQGFSQKIVVKS